MLEGDYYGNHYHEPVGGPVGGAIVYDNDATTGETITDEEEHAHYFHDIDPGTHQMWQKI